MRYVNDVSGHKFLDALVGLGACMLLVGFAVFFL